MREVNRKIVDIRNPTHIVLKTDEISADDVDTLSDSDNPSVLQIASPTKLPNDEEQQGEEVKIERTTGEKVPERKDMGRATSMDGKSNWSKAGKNYEFDATLKKTRNQLDVLKAPFDINTAQQDALAVNESDLRAWAEKWVDKELNQKIQSDPNASQYTIRFAGSNTDQSSQELGKIVGYSSEEANKMLGDMYNKNAQIYPDFMSISFW
tara:strand:+ start:193 stop:819 length:627 start_codon:yes stop_codon:yes gene_type:complete